MRIGLGCMRLSTDPHRDEDAALATLAAALDAGIPLFDTARAYGSGETDLGHNERLIARAWRARTPPPLTQVVTKCGMRRDGGAWIPDGRARRIAEDAEASVDALAGTPIDVLLLHAPDPRVALATSARALARVKEAGLARAVGVCNVSRKQLEEVVGHAPVAAVEVALGAYDDLAIRSGVVGYCLARGIRVFAYAPLGGPEGAARLARDRVLARVAARHAGVSAVDVFLAYLLAACPGIVPIVGARRSETIGRLAAADRLSLGEEDLATLDLRFPLLAATRSPPVVAPGNAEVVLVMGLPGAGKSRAAGAFVARGYERLNRDTLGGTLRAIAEKLGQRLRAGANRFVLDNTYVTRAARHDVVRIARTHGARVRCVFLATPLPQAQVNVVLRMLERFGRVLNPEELHRMSRTDPAALEPRALLRMMRDLEPPALDEGFAEIEVVPFERDTSEGGRPVVAIALDALGAGDRLEIDLPRILAHAPAAAPCLLYAWQPGADGGSIDSMRFHIDSIARAAGHPIDFDVCAHPPGPPVCWCRPPLPAMVLAFAHRRGADLRASTLVGIGAASGAIARALGMRFVEP